VRDGFRGLVLGVGLFAPRLRVDGIWVQKIQPHDGWTGRDGTIVGTCKHERLCRCWVVAGRFRRRGRHLVWRVARVVDGDPVVLAGNVQELSCSQNVVLTPTAKCSSHMLRVNSQ
jgi:hypothetical protein